MDETAFRSELARDGFQEVEMRTIAPDLYNPPHAHGFEVRALMFAGELTLAWEDQQRTFRAGRDLPHGRQLRAHRVVRARGRDLSRRAQASRRVIAGGGGIARRSARPRQMRQRPVVLDPLLGAAEALADDPRHGEEIMREAELDTARLVEP